MPRGQHCAGTGDNRRQEANLSALPRVPTLMVRKCALVIGVWVGLTVLAAGQFLIVPKGERAGSVTPKAVKAEMHAYGAYATARIEVSFATDPDWANEVDFMMRLPENSEATGFAYWFGDEYVLAKTVEKERAAQIYQFITSRQRDPALVELVGRRQFRVRIAPIDRTKDLRVEIKLVLTRSTGALALPLTALFHTRLESADLTLTTPNEWRENWGRESTLENGRRTYRYESKPWTARTDWRTSPPPTPVVASVGRPAQGDGTILVSYTAPRSEKVQLTGPKGVLSHIYPRQATVKAGQTVTFAARIAPGAPESVGLRVGSHRWEQSLPRQPFADRAAVVVWGANHVAALTNRDEIRKWGMWLSIPTKETSWLAVPKAEERALKQARLQIGMQEYWLTVAKFGRSSAQASRELQKVRNLVRDIDPKLKTDQQVDARNKWALENAADPVFNLLREQYGRAVGKMGKNSSAARGFATGIKNLIEDSKGRVGREDLNATLRYAVEDALNARLHTLLQGSDPPKPVSANDPELNRLWASLTPQQRKEIGVPYLIMNGLETAESLRLGGNSLANHRFAKGALTLAPIFGRVDVLRGQARANISQGELYALAEKWFRDERNAPRDPDPIETRTKQLDARLRVFQLTPQQARQPLLSIAAMRAMRAQPENPDPTKPLISADQKRFLAHYQLDEKDLLRRLYEPNLRNAEWRWYDLEVATRRDPAELEKARKDRDQWARVLGQSPIAKPLGDWRHSWRDFNRDDYVVALRKFGPDHPTTREALMRMEAADRQAGRTNRIPLRAEILQADLEIDRLSWRTLTPEETAKRDEMERRRKELFARMGDPLLIVVAPMTSSVSARLPDGRLVDLTWNARAQRWEHRFDLPPGSVEGAVLIPVWIRSATGQMESRVERIHVDQTPPKMTTEWTKLPTGWRLRVTTEAAVARVNVALPDGRRLVLARVAVQGDTAVWQVDIEGELEGEAIVIATDAAHNRTEVRRSFSH